MITFESAINRLAERVSDRRQENRNISLQRRNQVVDMYGMEFTRQGDLGRPATFYLSISPDLIYFERFEFKIIIEGFRIPLASNGISSTEVMVRPRGLEIEPTDLTTNAVGITVNNEQVTSVPSSHAHSLTPATHQHTILAHRHSIMPNPHDHETIPHTHNIVPGMSYFDISATNFQVFIEDIDMTPYFRALIPTGSSLRWIDGEGIFPAPPPSLENFDVLAAVAYMEREDRERILAPGYKKVQIVGDGVFNATLVNYLKYSHVNR